jgi:hypothetical protein
VEVDDEAHAAGVVLVGGIVEALGGGKSVGTRHCDTRVKGNCRSLEGVMQKRREGKED